MDCTFRDLIPAVSCGSYLVMVGWVVHDWACLGPKVLHGSGRDRDCCGGREEGKIQGQSLLQAAGAGEGSPQPLHPRHLIQKSRGEEYEQKSSFIMNEGSGSFDSLYLPCRNHRRPCPCPQRAGWSWLRWGCSRRFSPHSSPPRDS